MKFFKAVTFFSLMLSVCFDASAQQQQQQQQRRIYNNVQVMISLPLGVTAKVITVKLEPEFTGRPMQNENFINFTREINGTETEFSQVPNGEYTISIRADDGSRLESYSERISLQARFSQVRRVEAVLRKRDIGEQRQIVGTIDTRAVEIPKAARKAFDRGVEKSGKGKPDEAIKAFQEALAHYSDYFDAINNLAVEYIKADRCDQAVPLLERAVIIDPDSPLPHINLGIAFNKQRRFSEAKDELGKAIQMNFNNPLAHFQLGIACYLSDDLMRAQMEFETTVESKKIPLARVYLAKVYKQHSRAADAIKQLEAYLRESQENQYTETVRKDLAQLKQAR